MTELLWYDSANLLVLIIPSAPVWHLAESSLSVQPCQRSRCRTRMNSPGRRESAILGPLQGRTRRDVHQGSVPHKGTSRNHPLYFGVLTVVEANANLSVYTSAARGIMDTLYQYHVINYRFRYMAL